MILGTVTATPVARGARSDFNLISSGRHYPSRVFARTSSASGKPLDWMANGCLVAPKRWQPSQTFWTPTLELGITLVPECTNQRGSSVVVAQSGSSTDIGTTTFYNFDEVSGSRQSVIPRCPLMIDVIRFAGTSRALASVLALMGDSDGFMNSSNKISPG